MSGKEDCLGGFPPPFAPDGLVRFHDRVLFVEYRMRQTRAIPSLRWSSYMPCPPPCKVSATPWCTAWIGRHEADYHGPRLRYDRLPRVLS